ncbi:MAG: alginate export family protein [Planctomycetaceae bacterium]
MPRLVSLSVLSLLAIGLACSAQAQTPQPTADASWLFSDEPLLPGLKNQDFIEGWKYSAGAELRHRHMDERNRLRPLGATRRNIYELSRFTPWAELKHENVTLYVQGIDSESFSEDLPVLPVDVNRFDLLQYYADINLFDFDNNGQLRLKVGRQFLVYGSQHLVSNLGWSNTFRNFEGVKGTYNDEAISIDAFWTKPVNGAASARQFHPYSRDELDSSQTFSGVYATLKQAPGGTLDLYWLWLYEEDDLANRLDGNRHTIGSRYAGKLPLADKSLALTWDVEGAYQFGRDNVGPGPAKDVSAGFFSSLTGLAFNDLLWTPTVSALAFWSSGDRDPTDDVNQTFSTLFPLGHAYWGQIDNFSGSNLLDVGPQLSVKPHEKLTLATQYHFFHKSESSDFVWNVAGAPLGNLTTNNRDLGQELDLVATLQMNKNLQVQAGYFWFWYGDAVSGNAGIPATGDAQQFYLMTTWAF